MANTKACPISKISCKYCQWFSMRRNKCAMETIADALEALMEKGESNG